MFQRSQKWNPRHEGITEITITTYFRGMVICCNNHVTLFVKSVLVYKCICNNTAITNDEEA
jgi:hypothetical protein